MKINRKFKPLYTTNKRYSVITGGRGSGKSFAVSDFLLRLTYEKGHVILFTRLTLTSAHISIIPEFIEKIEILKVNEHFEIKQDSITNKLTGSVILFKGIRTSSGNQTANLKSIMGVTTWVLDEAEELTDEKIFDKIDDSIRTTTAQNRVIFILNPTTVDHWIHNRFFLGNEDVLLIHTTYLDNIDNLSESFILKAEKLRVKNPVTYDHRYLGRWMSKMDGVVFENWETGEFDETHQLMCFGQDYGFSNDPTTLIQVAVDKKHKKLYLKEHFYLPASKLGTNQIFELNTNYAQSARIVGDSQEARLIADLKKMGNNIVPCKKGVGSVSAGLMRMLDYDIIIDKNSLNLQKEFNNYVWIDKGSKLVIDDYNHGIDAARYAFDYLTNRANGQTTVS